LYTSLFYELKFYNFSRQLSLLCKKNLIKLKVQAMDLSIPNTSTEKLMS